MNFKSINFKAVNRKNFILSLAAVLGVSVIITSVAGKTADNSVPANNNTSQPTTMATSGTNQPTVVVNGETADISLECKEIKIITPSDATAEDMAKSKWTSSDNNIVTVDDGGRIDGISEGTATITAQIGNTRHTYNITVTAETPSIYDGYSTCYLANTDVLNENLNNVYEKNPYLLKVNRDQNCVTAYTYDKNGEYTVPIRAMICSTGIDKATVLGDDFYIYYKQEWNPLFNDVYGHYVSGFYGDYLFHSVPYMDASADTLETEEFNKLGGEGSLGCVRMETADVKWIYENCPENTQVIVYDDTNPGPLGKPEAIKITDHTCGWDPTDDAVENPYASKTPEIYGTSNLTINKGETADLLEGVTAVDTCSNDITSKISVTGNILTNKAGTYKLTYSVEDTMHRTNRVDVTVTVV
ncbi:L,D-transpeptidase family protein [Ruminococcus sp.]|uniref:L,D-transpeptidase family protein n=1 Tax=Ruminococcus sp. TaxID=41978 RepID=UPI003870A64E